METNLELLMGAGKEDFTDTDGVCTICNEFPGALAPAFRVHVKMMHGSTYGSRPVFQVMVNVCITDLFFLDYC